MRTPGEYSRQKSRIIILFLLSGTASFPALAQETHSLQHPQVDPNALARDVFQNEIASQTNDQSLWSYLELKQSHGVTQLFAVCQTNEGEIDRLLTMNGYALNAKQHDAEDQRIQRIVNHPEQIRKEQKKQQEDFRETQHLMRMFPDAFRFQYDGPQEGGLIRLNFVPNPNFHPSGHAAQVFHHLQGTLLVDFRQMRLAEINGRLTSEVKFFGGLLGHLDEGGTFFVKQEDLGAGHWELASININMNGKALFFKTITVCEKDTYSDYRQVPGSVTLQQAFTMLKEDASVQTAASHADPARLAAPSPHSKP